jgi:hypothetical protein
MTMFPLLVDLVVELLVGAAKIMVAGVFRLPCRRGRVPGHSILVEFA